MSILPEMPKLGELPPVWRKRAYWLLLLIPVSLFVVPYTPAFQPMRDIFVEKQLTAIDHANAVFALALDVALDRGSVVTEVDRSPEAFHMGIRRGDVLIGMAHGLLTASSTEPGVFLYANAPENNSIKLWRSLVHWVSRGGNAAWFIFYRPKDDRLYCQAIPTPYTDASMIPQLLAASGNAPSSFVPCRAVQGS